MATTEAALDEARANTAETLGGSTYVLALGVPDTLRIVQDEADVAVQLLGSFGLDQPADRRSSRRSATAPAVLVSRSRTSN